jgi:hypothetical protein
MTNKSRTEIDHKKQNRILWFSAIVLTFLAGYIHTVTLPDFPISGTIGIDGKRVSYRFERRASIRDTLDIFLRVDHSGLKAETVLMSSDKDSLIIPFEETIPGRLLRARIAVHALPAAINYRVRAFRNTTVFHLPKDCAYIRTYCVPQVPASILSVYYLTLFAGVILALRCGLEYFFTGGLIKKLALLSLVSFSLYGIIVVPVKTFLEKNAMNRAILQPGEMFSLQALAFVMVWGIGTVALFRSARNQKPIAASLAILTLLLFLAIR